MIKKLTHIILSFVLLIATVGLTVNLHYCQHRIYDIGIFSQAESCCAPKSDEAKHHMHCGMEAQQGNCEDETIKSKPVDDYINSALQFDFQNLSFADLFFLNSVVTDLFMNTSHDSNSEFQERNIPPPTTGTILSLLQTYLI